MKTDIKVKINNLIKMLRFILTIKDQEIIKSTIESAIEILEELSNK